MKADPLLHPDRVLVATDVIPSFAHVRTGLETGALPDHPQLALQQSQ